MSGLRPLYLTELLTSRLLHDMVGPVNALVSGLDLSEEQPELLEEMQSTVKTSARVIMSRLKFFRLCFGQGGYSNIQKPELEAIITDYLYFEPIKLIWKGHNTSEHMNKWGKLILHMVFHYSQTLPRGGQIEINLIGDTKTGSAHFIGQGDRPIFRNTPISILTMGKNNPSDPSSIEDKDLTTINAPAVCTYLLFQKMKIGIEYNEPLRFTLKLK